MNVFANLCLYILLLNRTLLVSSSQDAVQTIMDGRRSNAASDTDQGPSEIDKNKKSPTNFAAISENIKNEKPLETIQPSAWGTVFKYIAKGNELRNQYGFMIPKLVEMKLQQGSQLNIFQLISYLPYIVLALQKANAPPANEQSSNPAHGLGNMNLASVLQDPENLRKLFSEDGRGQLATDSVRLLAGSVASATVDKLIEELKQSATDKEGGIAGIDGPHLLAVLQKSDSFKMLFESEELKNGALNLLNTYMDSFLNPELVNMKDDVISEIKKQKSIRENEEGDNNNPVINAVRGTLTDSVTAFFKVGYKIMNEKLATLNSEADKSVAGWKKMADGVNNRVTPAGSTGQFKNVIINNAPNAVLKTLAAGQVLTTSMTNNQYHLIPSLAQYFLPTGISMDVLKFLSLVTYVMVKAQKENMIPEIDKNKVNNISGLNTERIVDTLNNKSIMAKIFPVNDHTNVRIAMLKFLAGPEAYIVDMIVEELKKLKNENGGGPLTIYDVLQNAEFFKKLCAMKEYTNASMKKYLGIDVGQLQTEIVDEYKRIDYFYGTSRRENDSIYNAVPRGTAAVANALSATYRVGMRKANEQMKNINEGIAMEAERMTRVPQDPSGESMAAGLVRRAASMAPTSVLYGVAGARVAADRLGGLYWWARGYDPTKNDRGPTIERKNEELQRALDAIRPRPIRPPPLP